jgi:hypothetical protein
MNITPNRPALSDRQQRPEGPGTRDLFLHLRIPALIIMVIAMAFFLWDLLGSEPSRAVISGALAGLTLFGFLVINREARKVRQEKDARERRAARQSQAQSSSAAPPAAPARRNAASLPKRAKKSQRRR